MTPWVTRLIIANAVVYLLTLAAPDLTRVLMLVPALVVLRPWTLVAYMFVHGGLMHLLFNMLGLFFFGPRLEALLGGRHFLFLYFVGGLAGAVFSFLTPYVAIVGASAGVFAMFIGFAYHWPRERLYIWGVMPIEARWLVVLMTILSLFGGFGLSFDNTAHLAHLGGFAGGYLYIKWVEDTSRSARFQRKLQKSAMRDVRLEEWKKIDPSTMHEVNRTEYERIMEKINSSGVEQLTPEEVESLNRFSLMTSARG